MNITTVDEVQSAITTHLRLLNGRRCTCDRDVNHICELCDLNDTLLAAKRELGHTEDWGMQAVPENLRTAIDAYADSGWPTGHFLEAVFSNDLEMAVRRADADSIRSFRAIIEYISTRVPDKAHGSKEIYDAWIEEHFTGQPDSVKNPRKKLHGKGDQSYLERIQQLTSKSI